MADTFLFMADAHIKGRTWVNSAALRGDAYAALDRVSAELDALPEQSRPDTLVIGGDWFDSNRPSSEDLVRSFAFLRRFARVLYIRGNHDSTEPSYLEADRTVPGHSVSCLDGTSVELGQGIHVTGASWQPSKDAVQAWTGSLRENVPEGLLFAVLHAPSKHLLGFDGSWQLDASALPASVTSSRTVLLAGDIHVRDTRRLSDTCVFHSPGSLYPLSWDRTGDPCAVSLVDARTGEISGLPCTVRSYHEIPFTGMRDLVQALEAVAADNRLPLPPFVRVRITGTSGYSAAPLPPGVVVQAVDDTLPDAVSGAAPAAASCSLEDAVRAECAADADLADMAASLLASADPLADIESWLEYWKVERI